MDVKIHVEQKKQDRTLGILGTGNMGRALAKRLVFSGYQVIIGSRRPEARQLSLYDECLCDVQLTSIKDCVKRCNIIFVAIHAENFKDTLHHHAALFKGKIVVDVSNRDNPSARVSNAEYLRTILPESSVVKCFNVVSAYVMENDIAGGSRRVFVASDDLDARECVSNIARDMGFAPIDFGCLSSARKIETFVLRFFPGWKVPIFFTFGVFNLWSLYIVYIYFVDKTAYRWDQIFVKVLNKPLCMTAITIMSLTYMPGCLAAFLQMFYGTKHKRFPKWVDKWLKSRKQFGLIVFVLVFVHALISLLLMSPTYYRSWFQPTDIHIPHNLTEDLHFPLRSWMIWKGEAACLVGIIAFVMLCLLATTTLPSVADTLNWREWHHVQSNLGYVVLLLSVTHVIIMGAPGWAKRGALKTVTSITFLSIILPMIVIVLKIILLVPCISNYVKRIRRGWERDPNPCLPNCVSSKETGEECISLKAAVNGGCGRCGCVKDDRVRQVPLLPTPSCDCSDV